MTDPVCPTCARGLAQEGFSLERECWEAPMPGDIALCAHCGEVLCVTSDVQPGYRLATFEDLRRLPRIPSVSEIARALPRVRRGRV